MADSETVTVPRTPPAEKAALESLVASEGWAIFERAMRAHCNAEAFERDVREATDDETAPIAHADVALLVKQISATHTAMRQMLEWPTRQIAVLDKAPVAKRVDPYAKVRAGGINNARP